MYMYMYRERERERDGLVSQRVEPVVLGVAVASSFVLVVLDEAHKLKNGNSANVTIIRDTLCKRRLLLTGLWHKFSFGGVRGGDGSK